MIANRGDIWTAAGGSEFLTKPRPVVILRSVATETSESATVCLLGTLNSDESDYRPSIEPSAQNGLITATIAMANLITTVRGSRLGRRIGSMGEDDMRRLDLAIVQTLGLSARH